MGTKEAEQPKLLTIPTKLREKIYKQVLVQKKCIDLSQDHNQKQPALLCTCSQIRAEALTIYYTENFFSYPIRGYDARQAIWVSFVIRKYTTHEELNFIVKEIEEGGCVDTDDLNRWLKLYHGDARIPALRYCSEAKKEDAHTIVRRCFNIVHSMRERSWAEVVPVLAELYQKIAVLQEREAIPGSSNKESSFNAASEASEERPYFDDEGCSEYDSDQSDIEYSSEEDYHYVGYEGEYDY